MKVKSDKTLLEMRLTKYDSISFRVYDSCAWLTIVCSAPFYILFPLEDMPFPHSRPDVSYIGRQVSIRVYKTSLDQFYNWFSSALAGLNDKE